MKTYKDFRKDLEENNIIASAIDKYKQMKEKKKQYNNTTGKERNVTTTNENELKQKEPTDRIQNNWN